MQHTLFAPTKVYQEAPLLAIFETPGWYIICSRSRGAMTGAPLYIDGKDVAGVIEYKYACI